MTEADDIRRKRADLKRAYGTACARLSDILFREDPMEVNFEFDTDEYEPEVDTILPRLRDTRSVDDVLQIVHEEFVEWFGASATGPPEKYKAVADRVWAEVVPLLRT